MATELTKTKLAEIVKDIKEKKEVIRIRYDESSKLTTANYTVWAQNMVADLRSYGLLPFVESDFDGDARKEPSYSEYQKVTIEQIVLNVAPDLAKMVTSESTAKSLWSKLIELVCGSGYVKAMKLFKKVNTIMGDPNMSIESWRLQMRQVVDDVKRCWPSCPDDLTTGLALCSIPDRFASTRTVLLATKDLTVDKIFELVHQEEHFNRAQEKQKLMSGCNLNVKKNPNTNRQCNVCGSGDHLWRQCPTVSNYVNQQNQPKQSGGKPKGKGKFKPKNSHGNHGGHNGEASGFSGHADGGIKYKSCALIVDGVQYNPSMVNWDEEEGEPIEDQPLPTDDREQEASGLNELHSHDKQPDVIDQTECEAFAETERDLINIDELELFTEFERELFDSGVNEPAEAERQTEAAESVETEPNPNTVQTKPDPGMITVHKELPKCKVCTIVSKATTGQDLDPMATYLDSGAAAMIRNSRRSCIRFYEQGGTQVETADGTICETEGIGVFRFKTETGHIIDLQNCLVCPHVKASFMSVGVLDDLGYRFEILRGRVRIFDRKELFLTATKQPNGLYKVHLEEMHSIRVCVITKGTLIAYNWHRRLIHRNFADIHRLKHRLGIEIPNVNQIRCEDCLAAKTKRLPFEQSEIKSTEPLELVHTDLSGIKRIGNKHNVKYYLHFTDDYSRYRVAYLLNNKTQVGEAFEDYKKTMELKTGKRIKALRSDNGTEFKNTVIFDLLDAAQSQYTEVDSPASNGVAERGMGVIKESIKVMLHAAGMDEADWPPACIYAVHVANRMPNASINYEIPYERLFKRKVDFNRLHAFGDKVIVMKLPCGTGFGPNGRRGKFMGISEKMKGYIIRFTDNGEERHCREVNFMDERYITTDTAKELFNMFPDERPSVDSGHESVGSESSTDQPLESNEPNDQHSEQTAATESEQTTPTDDPAELTSNQSDYLSADEQAEIAERTRDWPTGLIVMDKNEEAEFRAKYPDATLTHNNPIYGGKKYKGPPKNTWLVNCLTIPKSYKQAVESTDSEHWQTAMREEMLQLLSMKAFKVVKRPKGSKVLKVMWIYTVKTDRFGAIERYKARAVVLGNQEEQREDLELYAPVISGFAIKTLMSLATQYGYKMRHFDFKGAYLTAPIRHQVFITGLPGFEIGPDECLELNKAWYGLRTSALDFYLKMRDTMYDCGLLSIYTDECIYVSNDKKRDLILGSHVDDSIVLYKDDDVLGEFYEKLNSKITTTDNGIISSFLGMEADHDIDQLHIHQRKYAQQMLKQFGFENCKPVPTPMSTCIKFNEDAPKMTNKSWYQTAVGSLLYYVNSRPDLAYAVGYLCRFISNPTVEHEKQVKRVFRYIAGTLDHGLIYKKSSASIFKIYSMDVPSGEAPQNGEAQNGLTLYADADFGNEMHQQKSISGVMMFMGDNLVHWISRRQNRIAHSTCEAEVLSIQEAVFDAEYLKSLLTELGYGCLLDEPIRLYNDNQGAVMTIANGGKFGTNRHYKARVNAVREADRKKLISLKHLPGDDMRADLLTKALSPERLTLLLKMCGVGPRPT